MSRKEIEGIYDSIAHKYEQIRKKPCYNSLIEMPTTFSLFEDLDDKLLLDAGCGNGIYAKMLSDKGANVIGTDISKNMLNLSKKKCPDRDFLKNSIDELCFKDETFDIVLSSLTVHYLKNPVKAFEEFSRVLKPGGYAIFSVFHPSRSLLKKNLYFSSKKMWEEWDDGIKVFYYNHTFQDYTEAICDSGLSIERICEPHVPEFTKVSHPDFYKKHYQKPECLVMKLRKG